MISVYFPNEQYPYGGAMSQHVNSLSIGDKLKFIGPRGNISYRGNGELRLRESKDRGEFNQIVKTKSIVMIAGGTGIAPMYQIIQHVCKDDTDQTKLWLLFANRTENDILCRNGLEAFSNDSRFTLHYTLSRPNDDWKGRRGYITAAMISDCFPSPNEVTVVLLCGPPGMIKQACLPNLGKYNSDRIFTY